MAYSTPSLSLHFGNIWKLYYRYRRLDRALQMRINKGLSVQEPLCFYRQRSVYTNQERSCQAIDYDK